MVLPLSNAKITVGADGHRYQFRTHAADIGSIDNGVTHLLHLVALHGMTKDHINTKEAPVPPEEHKTPKSSLTNEQQQGLDNIIRAAKGIERQKLLNARAIDAAIREAEKLTADAEHKFNMAVLETLHTGLTSFTIDAKLEDTGFGEFTEKTDYIGALDTSMLYVTEA